MTGSSALVVGVLLLHAAPVAAQIAVRAGIEAPLVIIASGQPGLLQVPGFGLASQSLTVPQVEARKNRGRGALWGAGIGLVAGGVLGGLSVQGESDGDFGSGLVESAATGEGVVIGAVFGAGLGALLGATVFAPSASPAEGHAVRLAPTVSGRRFGLNIGIH